jgi:hypothetical protein
MLTVSACSGGFRLSAVPSEEVPTPAKEFPTKERALDVVRWLACYEQGEFTVVCCERRSSSPVGGTYYDLLILAPDTSGKLQVIPGGGRVGEPGRSVFAWEWGVTGGHGWNAQNWPWFMDAQGMALTRDAAKVVATLTNGQKVEAPIVNGFWYIRVDEPRGDFSSVVLLGRSGEVLHTYEAKPGAGTG